MTIKQPLTAKIGEVSFRQKLADQHFGKNQDFPEELDSQEMWRVINEKISRARSDFKTIKSTGLLSSPFLEIGAGYGQSSLLLTNEFKGQGWASDIALAPLQKLPLIAKKLKAKTLPKMIVFDAENIPFPDNSFPFIFCYQTLHHFPDPTRVCQEVARVLSPGGVFLFAEEPVAQTLNVELWRRPTKLRWWEKILKATLLLLFISKIGKTEVDHGIIEASFTRKTWRQALEVFDSVNARLFPFPWGPIGQMTRSHHHWNPPSFLTRLNYLWVFFFGGGITGTAQKVAQKAKANPAKIICVNCAAKKPLRIATHYCVCPSCGYRYQRINGCPVILVKKLNQTLYPRV